MPQLLVISKVQVSLVIEIEFVYLLVSVDVVIGGWVDACG